jgi:hypothetical protein
MDREEMAAWAYAEANPGYRKEIGLTMSDLTDDYGEPYDPDFARVIIEQNAAENAAIRAGNERTALAELRAENDELRALLTANGITPPPERD